MCVTMNGLIFDNQMEASRFMRDAKDELYKAGWRWTGKHWFLLEKRKPGIRLHIELPNWAEAIDWERKMKQPQTENRSASNEHGIA